MLLFSLWMAYLAVFNRIYSFYPPLNIKPKFHDAKIVKSVVRKKFSEINTLKGMMFNEKSVYLKNIITDVLASDQNVMNEKLV